MTQERVNNGGVVNTSVFQATQKIFTLANLAGHPEDIQVVLNILFGVNTGSRPMTEESIQKALKYTWDNWYASDGRYTIGTETPMEEYLNSLTQQKI